MFIHMRLEFEFKRLKYFQNPILSSLYEANTKTPNRNRKISLAPSQDVLISQQYVHRNFINNVYRVAIIYLRA